MTQNFNCPSCGAPLEPQGEQKTIICKYCGESVIVPEDLRDHPHVSRPRTHAPRVEYSAPVIGSFLPSKNPMRPFIIFIVIIVVSSVVLPIVLSIAPLAVGLIAVWGPMMSSNSKVSSGVQNVISNGKPDVRLEQPVIFPPDEDTLTPNYLALLQNNATDVYQYVMVDGKSHNLLWRSEDLGAKESDARAFFMGKQIFIVNEATLSALDRSSGKSLWKTPLDNGLGTCNTCLVVAGSNVIAILKDGTLQAVDAGSGKLTWHKTLSSTHSDLFLANGQPAVKDFDENKKNIIYIFDPVTGKIAQQLQPGCPAKTPDEHFSDFEVNPDGKSMLVFYERCLQTVSLPDGKMITELMSPQSDNGKSAWPYAWFATHYLVGGNSIFYTMQGSDKSVYMIDIIQGNPKPLIADNKYTLSPKFLLGKTLVVEALPTFDGTQVEYWGVDALSGKRLWQYALKGEHDLRYHDARATSNGGIFVTQCRESPGKCTWADIDAKTGVGSNSGTASGGTFFDAAWYKDTFYLGNEGELMVINMLTGKLVYQWP